MPTRIPRPPDRAAIASILAHLHTRFLFGMLLLIERSKNMLQQDNFERFNIGAQKDSKIGQLK